MTLRLGLDTGGTCTDAVLLRDGDAGEPPAILASAKALTTHERLIDGLREATLAVTAGCAPGDISLVSLSTTLATNALVEGRGRPVGLVLIGYAPERLGRAQLGEALGGDPVAFLAGGHDAAGSAVAELDLASLERFAQESDARVEAWAVSAMFAVRNPAHEVLVAERLRRLTGKPVSTGHRLSRGLDAPRRALTALLNARLVPLIDELLDAAGSLLGERGIAAPLMVVKGDGSLVRAALAREIPVETILSGPAASVVGARWLHALDDCTVVDIGGTTTDIARIENGRPRLDPDGACVGGWRTMVEAIEIETIGLGGDSDVSVTAGTGQGMGRLGGEARLALGPARVVPLSLLSFRAGSRDGTGEGGKGGEGGEGGVPTIVDVLRRQLERGYPKHLDGRFAVARVARAPAGLPVAQRELLERVLVGPVALEALFASGASERASSRLEGRGLLRRAAFTPSDAAHVLGRQTTWDAEAARLGAALRRRELEQGRGPRFASDEAFAEAVFEAVSLATALAVAGCAGGASGLHAGARDERRRWLEESLRSSLAARSSAFELRPRLTSPVVGLGASAHLYHPLAARLLDTPLAASASAGVANALGAVVGVVRQARTVVILAAGGDSVRVMLDTGPVHRETLEEGLPIARAAAAAAATDAARAAGTTDVELEHAREDTSVERDGRRVFFESRITATAIGRPEVTRDESG